MSHRSNFRQKLLSRLLAGFVFFASLFVLPGLLTRDLSAQQEKGKNARGEEVENEKKSKKAPAVKEEVEKGPKQKRKPIQVDDDDAGPRKKSGQPAAADSFSGGLAAMLKQTKHPGMRDLCRNLLKPHDVIDAQYSTTKTREKLHIEPLVKFLDREPKLERPLPVVRFDQNWEALQKSSLAPNVVKGYTPYEALAQELVDAFLKERWDNYAKDSGNYLSRRDMLAVAYQVLADVANWHRSARSRDERMGEEWKDVQENLEKKLLEIREKQLDDFLQSNDWNAASDLARDISRRYADKVVQERLAKRLTKYIVEESPKGGLTGDKLREVRERLRQLEEQFPGSSATEAISNDLKEQAQRLFNDGRRLIEELNQKEQGLARLKEAVDLFPTLPGLQQYYLRQREAYPILRVGVRGQPDYMAPGVAWTESERQAVEMIFEGLVKQVPVYSGGPANPDLAETYKPALAERMPTTKPSEQLVRHFLIAREAMWALAADKSRRLTNGDLNGTYQFMAKDETSPVYAPAWAQLVQNVFPGDTESQVNVSLKHGFIDPYAAMTFKVLPDEASGKDYKERFARNPFGSGPYRLEGVRTIEDESRMVFMANPFYSARPGRRDLPRIREVHFSVSVPEKALASFAPDGKLDLLLPDAVRDLGAAQLAELRKFAKVIGPLPTRRVYFLAINLRKPVFEMNDPAALSLRRAIAHAIPRQEILKDVFGGLPGDKALTGPYPPDSWACVPLIKIKLLDNPQLAAGNMKEPGVKEKLAIAGGRLTLTYPDDDKTVAKAMEVICSRLEKTLGIKIEPKPERPHVLREQVASHA